MAITKLPYTVQPAFNDVWVRVSGESSLSFIVFKYQNPQVITLSRETINNYANYNLSGILKDAFYERREYLSTNNCWAAWNFMLGTQYVLDSKILFVINAVQRRGESLDLMSIPGRDILTERKPYSDSPIKSYILNRYDGYPFGTCLFLNNDKIQISLLDHGGNSIDEISLPENTLLIPVLELYMDSAVFADAVSVKQVQINYRPTVNVSKRILVDVIDRCTPEYPVYLRWINHLGGYEYWMFSGRKVFGEDVKRGDSYWLGGGQEIDSTATRGELAPTVDNSIACGAEQLDEDDFRLLKGIFLSPYVEMYNTDRKLFERVILRDSSSEWDTANSRGVIDIEFSLIDQPIQF